MRPSTRPILLMLLAFLLAACRQQPIPTAPPELTTSPVVFPPTATAAPVPSATIPTAATRIQWDVKVLTGHTGQVTRLAWSPDGAWLATACAALDAQDFTIRLWNSEGAPGGVISGHTAPVMALAWSPDGKTLASASVDGTTRLWGMDSAPLKVLEGGAGQMFAAAWSPDGQYLATGSIVQVENPTVQIWDRAGKVIRTLRTSFSGGKFYNLAWSPDGKFLLGGATDYKLWHADGSEVYWLQGCAACTPAWGMAWSPDSTRWAVGDESGYVHIFDTQGRAVAKIQDQAGVTSLAWSPNGRVLAGAKTLWSADGRVINSMSTQPRYVYSAAWSADGKILATAGSESNVHLWSVDGSPTGLLQSPAGEVEIVAWSPVGSILASGHSDGSVRLWRIK